MKIKFTLLLKGISHKLETIGFEFIEILKKEGALQDLISFLYQDIERLAKNTTSSSTSVIPINWLESKIENIRKKAIESTKSLSVDDQDVQVKVLANKELIFKRTDSCTLNITR